MPRYSHPVLRYDRSAVFQSQYYISALGAKGDLDGVGKAFTPSNIASNIFAVFCYFILAFKTPIHFLFHDTPPDLF